MNFESAKTFGIIYDSTISGSDIAVTKIAESLRNKGKEVAVFAFLNDKKIEQKDDVVIFNANDVNWYGVPKSDKVLQFCDRKIRCYTVRYSNTQSAIRIYRSFFKSAMPCRCFSRRQQRLRINGKCARKPPFLKC
jgi:hypothetical protein